MVVVMLDDPPVCINVYVYVCVQVCVCVEGKTVIGDRQLMVRVPSTEYRVRR